ncbi:MAG: TatD family hydrolase [Lachnospiraceae bacterium]|nr:TatD family hydrolase [Lachnospiraceae bacterium]
MIFDTHAHYDDEAFDEDRDDLLMELHEKQNIAAIANVGFHKASIASTHALADRYPFIYEVLGFHPDETYEMEEAGDDILLWLKEQLARPKAIAVGEIGLDYYWDKTPREIQKKWFRAQLALAKDLDLPVVIHSREAAADTLQILQENQIAPGNLDMHCYSYSPEQAEIYLKMGYYLGIGGVSTFKNAKKLKEVIALAPLEQLLLETDAPYLTPTPFRGKRNDSGKIPLVISAIAQIKGISEKQVEEACYANALRFYRLEA